MFNEVLTSCRNEVVSSCFSKQSSEKLVDQENGLIILEDHKEKRKLLSGFVKEFYTHIPGSLSGKEIDENLYKYALESYSEYEYIYSQLVRSSTLDLDTSFGQLG